MSPPRASLTVFSAPEINRRGVGRWFVGAPSILLWSAIALACVACGHVPAAPAEAPVLAEQLVWPRPPAPARVRFIRNIVVPSDWGISRGAFQRLADKLTGQRPLRFVRPTGVAARGSVLYVADPGAQALVVLEMPILSVARTR